MSFEENIKQNDKIYLIFKRCNHIKLQEIKNCVNSSSLLKQTASRHATSRHDYITTNRNIDPENLNYVCDICCHQVIKILSF